MTMRRATRWRPGGAGAGAGAGGGAGRATGARRPAAGPRRRGGAPPPPARLRAVAEGEARSTGRGEGEAGAGEEAGGLDPATGCPRARTADVTLPPGAVGPMAGAEGGGEAALSAADRQGFLTGTLTARVYDVAVETPLERADRLSDQTGNDLLLKREDLQEVFSFKLRGAYNKMASLSPAQLERGVVCSSAGNHAQGVALAAARLGTDALICMPLTTPDIKVANVRRLGATVELVGETYDETQAYAMEAAAAEGRSFIAPFDDPHVICGQGTIGNEILRQVKDIQALHAIFVPVGGGGLLAGVAAFVKQVAPWVKVIGVEPADSNCLATALAAGRRVTLEDLNNFADGVAVKTVGAETFRVCREFCDGVVLVSTDEICAAIKDVFNDTRSILEPAGAVAPAGAKAYLKHHDLRGQTVVAITSGANMNFDRLRMVSDLADVGARREVMMATSIPEEPGAFKRFVAALAGDSTSLDITELKYRCVGGGTPPSPTAGVRLRLTQPPFPPPPSGHQVRGVARRQGAHPTQRGGAGGRGGRDAGAAWGGRL